MAIKQNQQKRQAQKKKQRQRKIRKQAETSRNTAEEPIDVQVDQALALLDVGHMGEGRRLIERLGRKHAGNSRVQYCLGVLAAKQERYEDAARWFEKTVKTTPDDIEAHYNLAVAYQKLRDYTHMALAFQYVIDHGEPGSLTVKHAVKTLSEMENRLREKEGIGIEAFLEGHMCFQKGLENMAAKDWNAAVASFRSAIDAHPKNIQSYGNLGICYAILGKRKEALDALDKALELDPGYQPARLHRDKVATLKEGDALGGHDKNMG